MNRLQQIVAKFNSNDEVTLKEAISHVLDLSNPAQDAEILKPVLRYLNSKVGRSAIDDLTSVHSYFTLAIPTQKEDNGGDIMDFNKFDPSTVEDFDIWEISCISPRHGVCNDEKLLANILWSYKGSTFDLNEIAEDAICVKPYCDEAFGLIYCVMRKLQEFGYIVCKRMPRSRISPLKDKRYGKTMMAMLEAGWQNPRSVFLKGLVALEDLIQLTTCMHGIIPGYIEHAIIGTTVEEMDLRLDKHMNSLLRQELLLTPLYILDITASSKKEED